jgi:hypothetical protein
MELNNITKNNRLRHRSSYFRCANFELLEVRGIRSKNINSQLVNDLKVVSVRFAALWLFDIPE